MKIQNTEMEFVTFDAQDVITTSTPLPTPKWASDATLAIENSSYIKGLLNDSYTYGDKNISISSGGSYGTQDLWILDYSLEHTGSNNYDFTFTYSYDDHPPMATEVTVSGSSDLDDILFWLFQNNKVQ